MLHLLELPSAPVGKSTAYEAQKYGKDNTPPNNNVQKYAFNMLFLLNFPDFAVSSCTYICFVCEVNDDGGYARNVPKMPPPR